jgi:endonuclease V-like protein UPF0215 family
VAAEVTAEEASVAAVMAEVEKEEAQAVVRAERMAGSKAEVVRVAAAAVAGATATWKSCRQPYARLLE